MDPPPLRLHVEIYYYTNTKSNKMLVIVGSYALDIKGGMKLPNLLECSPVQLRVKLCILSL